MRPTGGAQPTGAPTFEDWERPAKASGSDPIRLADFEALALATMPPALGAYYSGAANDEVTLADNVAAFERRRFLPHIGVAVEGRDTSVEVFGRRWPTPFMVAPMSLHRLADPEGEVAVARACAARGLVFSLSTVGTTTIEDVASSGAARWFQLYLLKDRGRNAELLARAEAAGYEAIILTMDGPILGRRERDIRTGFSLPPGVTYANIRRGAIKRDDTYGDDAFKPENTWDDLAWVVGATRLPVVVKGVLRADDAVHALDLGAAAVDVSNHGGRQLDRSIASIDALPAIADAVAGRAPILLDSGIRRGTDVLTALALGARAVMVGRPVLWSLAWGGEAGVGLAFDLLAAEVNLALGIAGLRSPTEASRDLIVGG
ncbi:MAG TPA: alpha-hydroxy acid oxidase [Candidatus Limnocylindrales bacterium]